MLHLGRAQLAALPDCQPSDLEVSEPRAAEFQHRMTYRFEHSAYLTVFALMYHYLCQCGIAVMLQQVYI